MESLDGTPWSPCPERLDRRLRLGPFASGRDVLKFVTSIAVAAIVSLAIAPWAGLPIAMLGAVVSLWRPNGEALDERLLARIRWAARRNAGPLPMTGLAPGGAGSGRTSLVLADGRSLAVLRTGGVPLAFLPPAELARQFELYRQLLRSVEAGLLLHATGVPICAEAIRPTGAPRSDEEAAARDGYRELVELLARRRTVRRVLVAVLTDGTAPERTPHLEGAVGRLRERLADLGLRSERLRDRALVAAARQLGLATDLAGAEARR
jgi:hypothetical protein